MVYSKELELKAKAIIDKHCSDSDRVRALNKEGFNIRECPMKGYSIGRVKTLEKEIRIQVSSNRGRYQYAKCVVFNKREIPFVVF